jgi:hypothetical protein
MLGLVALALAVGAPARAEDQPEDRDQICHLLFDAYIARRGKINTSTIMAASHIITERGRNSGFWRHILGELKEGHEASETKCVRILGRMLSIDAAARDAIRREKETGQPGQWKASVRLGPEVVETLVARGENADRHRATHYAIALARARVSEPSEFFRMILRDHQGVHYLPTARFYAAVGLAQLGDPQGIEWLIENSEGASSTVSCAWPRGVTDGHLTTSCVAALRMLSGKQDLSTKREWKSWWEKMRDGFRPHDYVTIMDSR